VPAMWILQLAATGMYFESVYLMKSKLVEMDYMQVSFVLFFFFFLILICCLQQLKDEVIDPHRESIYHFLDTYDITLGGIFVVCRAKKKQIKWS
jgi:hypothetical protein